MNHSLQKLKDAKVELTVEVSKDELLQFVAETEKAFSNELRADGFRQGKVPRDVMRQRVGEDVIRQDALQRTIESTLADALSEEKLDIISQEDFKIKENTPDKLVYTVVLLVYPPVELGPYKDLELKKNPIIVLPEEIQKVIDEVRQSRTSLHTVERPAQLGDRVEVDFTLKDGETIIEGGKSENHPIVLGEKRFVIGFEDHIIGMKVGEHKSFELPIPEDYFQKSIAGKTLSAEVELKKVEERHMPDVDDDFAKSLGRFTSVKELETNIEQGLTLEKENKEKERLRLKLVELIAEKSSCEIPAVLVEQRLESMLASFDQELHTMGMELGPYLSTIKKTQDELKEGWRKQAETQVKSSLILRAIAQAEKLKVSDEEMTEELQVILQQYTAQQGDLKNIKIEEIKNRLYNLLLNEKVFTFLESHSTIS